MNKNKKCFYCNKIIKSDNKSTICIKCKKTKKKIKELGLTSYLCKQCYIIHKSKIGICNKSFVKHFNHRTKDTKLTQSEIWKYKMSKSLENYSIKKHKKSLGSKKQ